MSELIPRCCLRTTSTPRGTTGIVAGSERFPGAAVLSVGAALHAKPGVVRYCGPVVDAVVSQWPSAIVSTRSPK